MSSVRGSGANSSTSIACVKRVFRLNLANGENIKTVAVLMGHASSAYTLDLYAAYVPNTGIGIGTRYMNFLRAAT